MADEATSTRNERIPLLSTSTIREFRRSLWLSEKIHAPKAPKWIQARAADVLPDYYNSQSSPTKFYYEETDTENERICDTMCSLWKLCCFISFLPCANTRRVKGSLVFGIVILVPSLVFMVMTALGPLHCAPLTKTSAITMSISFPILILMVLNCCFSTLKLYDTGWPNSVLYTFFCCNCLSLIVLLTLTVVGSCIMLLDQIQLDGFVSGSVPSQNITHIQYHYAPIGSVCLVYLSCAIFTILLIWFLLCNQ